MRVLILFFAILTFLNASASGDLHLDELGSADRTYYLKDEVSGNSDGQAHKLDSTGNDGGQICSALDFSKDSANDYAVIDKNALNGTTDFTISIWHKGKSGDDSNALISGAKTGQDNEILWWFGSSTKFVPHINGKTKSLTVPNINDGSWHHLVWRQKGKEACYYFDGNKQGCVKFKKTHKLSIESLILGQDQDSVGGSFDANQDWEGLLDELLIFKRALSDDEIQDIYNNEKNGKNYDGSNRTCQNNPPVEDGDNHYSDFHFDELEYNQNTNEVKDSHWSKDGIGYNVPLVKGKICNGADLRADGAKDYIKINEKALDGAKSFTISVWNKSSSDNSHALLSGATNGSDNEILFWMRNNEAFRGHIKNKQRQIATPSISDGKWHHLVWRLDGMESCFFFDGVKQGCKNYSQSYTLHIKSLILGQDQDNVGGGFDKRQDWEGIIDELLIFRRALSDSEIADIYNNQNAGKNWDGTTRVCPYPKVIKTSCIVSDPVNNTTHPKRIPGAKIRYALEAKNPNTSKAHDILVEDNVDNSFDASTISKIKISKGSCNCQNPSNLSNNGSNGSSNGQNPVKFDFGSIEGGKSKCGYFEVEIK